MPNHVHGIIEISQKNDVGEVEAENVGAENVLPLQEVQLQNEFQKMIPRSIGSIVKGFKIGVTKWFRYNSVGVENIQPDDIIQPMEASNLIIWQRNYYEYIIRNEESYQCISDYIINNPLNWGEDKFFK